MVILRLLVLLLFCVDSTWAADHFKWAPGQAPNGQTNGPDQLDDLWQDLYNAWALEPAGDEDNDGTRNLDESLAGTNPTVPNEAVRVDRVKSVGNDIQLRFKARAGKRYRLLTSNSPFGSTWTPVQLLSHNTTEVSPVADSDAFTLSVARGGPNRFFKVEVSDMDSDGDGVSDWAERRLGLDLQKRDSDDDGEKDGARLERELATTGHWIQVEPTQPLAVEAPSKDAVLTITRSRSTRNVRVTFVMSGDALPGTDYTLLRGDGTALGNVSYVDLAAGQAKAEVRVHALGDTLLEGGEIATLTLQSVVLLDPVPQAHSPQIGLEAEASVVIANAINEVGTGLRASYYNTASTDPHHASNFGKATSYSFTANAVTLPYTTPQGGRPPAIGDKVRLSFTSGGLAVPGIINVLKPITATTPSSFTVAIDEPGLTVPQSATGDCFFAFEHVPTPTVLERMDAKVDFDWGSGTPVQWGTANNGLALGADEFSATWETWIAPPVAGSYRFRIDADDRARVFLDTGSGLTEIVQDGWDSPGTVGAFVESSAIALELPATPQQRYRLRVEMVETTGAARCRLQWRRDDLAYADIPLSSAFSHAQPMAYNYQRNPNGVSGQINVTPSGSHSATVGSQVHLRFSYGPLNAVQDFNGQYTVIGITQGIINVAVSAAPGTSLPESGGGGGFIRNAEAGQPGWLMACFANTSFATPVAQLQQQALGPMTVGSGIYGTGSPDPLIEANTYSVRWTGQIAPEFSEDYTLYVDADDGVRLSINGEPLLLRATDPHLPGSSYTYSGGDNGSGEVVVDFAASALKESALEVGDTVIFEPTSGPMAITAPCSYAFNASTGVMTVSYANQPNLRATAFAIGDRVELDPDSGTLADVEPSAFTITSVNSVARSFTVGLPTQGRGSDSGKSVKLSSARRAQVTAATPTSFTVNVGTSRYISGGNGSTNLSITNQPLKDWASYDKERHVTLPMVASARYDLQLDYHQQQGSARCKLSWFSPSRGKQIVPTARLYAAPPPPAAGPFPWPAGAPVFAAPFGPAAAGAGALGLPTGLARIRRAFVNEPFTERLATASLGTITISGLPSWLSYNAFTRTLSGSPLPADAGFDSIRITKTPIFGLPSTSLLTIWVVDASTDVETEHLTFGPPPLGLSFTSATDGSDRLNDLSWAGKNVTYPTGVLPGYGRVRGYITAPEDGNYYFWIAGGHAATLSISNDDEPLNIIERCSTSGGTADATAMSSNWTDSTEQKSHWLRLVSGQRYFFTVTYRETASDYFAVGWAKPSDASTAAPSEIIPGSLLSAYEEPAEETEPLTQFVATMVPVSGAVSSGYGSATITVNEATLDATLTYRYSGISNTVEDGHVHNADLSSIVIELNTVDGSGAEVPPPMDTDNTVPWTITALDLDALKAGRAYINIHTDSYPDGEILGWFVKVNASHDFTVPASLPDWTTDSQFQDSNTAAVVRFLTQATFGPNIADIQALQALTTPATGTNAEKTKFAAWISAEFAKPVTHHYDDTDEQRWTDDFVFDDDAQRIWWKAAMTADDQLRQRVAFALSEILVVSAKTELTGAGDALSQYYDTLLDNAFGNYRDLLKAVSLTPGMGYYLDMFHSGRPTELGDIPNENFARELMQLFSIGLYRQWLDGTYVLDADGALIPTYTQDEIEGLAHVFTGWNLGYGATDASDDSLNDFEYNYDFSRPMRSVPPEHYTGTKRSINNVIIPGITEDPDGNVITNHYATTPETWDDAYATNPAAQAFKDLAETELDVVIDQLFNHPNIAPFVCRQLIQRLVTSSPSQGYVYRVAKKFEDNGSGVRGDMQAVIKAILLDSEARAYDYAGRSADPEDLETETYGKQREPLLRVAAAARAFRSADVIGTYEQADNDYNLVLSLPSASLARMVTGGFYWLDFSGSTDLTGATAKADPPDTTYYATNVVADSGTGITMLTTTAKTWHGNGRGVAATGHAAGTFDYVSMSHHLGSDPTVGTDAFIMFDSGFVAYWDHDGNSSTAAQLMPSGNYTVYPYDTDGDGTAEANAFRIAGATTFTQAWGSYLHMHVLNGELRSSEVDPMTGNVTLTINTSWGNSLADHEMSVGDQVDFKVLTDLSIRGTWTVASVVDANTFTVTEASGVVSLTGVTGVRLFPHVSPITARKGTVTVRAGTYRLGSLDEELDQTPLSAPSVFSWYLPDYRHTGALGATWATVPEFQRTTDTTVINQANYFGTALYPDDNSYDQAVPAGIGYFSSPSYRYGTDDSPDALVLSFGDWDGNATDLGLGAGTDVTKPWTANANVGDLVDRLMTLLNVRPSMNAARSATATSTTAASAGLSVRDIILRHVMQTISSMAVDSTDATRLVIITTVPHGLEEGDSITISGVTGGTFSPSVNGTFTIVAATDTTFTITCTANPTGAVLTSAHVSSIPYDDTSPTDDQKDQRLRAILHLIMTSPDYIIQR